MSGLNLCDKFVNLSPLGRIVREHMGRQREHFRERCFAGCMVIMIASLWYYVHNLV